MPIASRGAPPPLVFRPSTQQIESAYGARVSDVIDEDLRVLFCGINPSLYSGAVGHHFARPGNRFWKALHGAGFTDRLLWPFEEQELIGYGLGVTNLVRRATRAADELTVEELRRGAKRLSRTVCRYRPAFVALLGVAAFRTAFSRPAAEVGPRPETICGSRVWLLPNPSGLNAHYQLPELVKEFADLRTEISLARRGKRASRRSAPPTPPGKASTRPRPVRRHPAAG